VFIILFLTYTLILILYSRRSRLIILIFSIEILSWMFLLLIPTVVSLRYLIIQRYFLLVSIFSFLSLKEILLVGVILKLGLPPFHSWFIRITSVIVGKVFLFLSTIHKLLPLLFLRKLISTTTIVFLSRLIVIASIYLVDTISLFSTLVFSSITHSLWIVFSSLLRLGFILIYFVLYSIVIVSLLSKFSLFHQLNQIYLISRSSRNLSWLVLSGLPPLALFWMKVGVLYWLLLNLRLLRCLILLITRVFALRGYFRAMFYRSLVLIKIITQQLEQRVIIVFIFWWFI
jgi:hypothetical protein